MKKILAITLALITAVCILSSCNKNTYSTSVSQIKEKGVLVIGLDDTFAPMGFRDKDGTLVGFDIDLATLVCEKLGVKASFKPIDWNSKEMELSSGNIDCIWNGMSTSPTREKEMSLSQPYLSNMLVIMGKDGVELNSTSDLANLNIGVQAGSAALDAIKADSNYEQYSEKVTEYPTYDEVVLDMQAGRLDCMVIDEAYGSYKNKLMGSPYSISNINFGADYYVVGFRKADTELRDEVNKIIIELIANGKAVEISEKWFNEDLTVKG